MNVEEVKFPVRITKGGGGNIPSSLELPKMEEVIFPVVIITKDSQAGLLL